MATSVVLDAATSNKASPTTGLSPIAKAVMSKMAIVSDEVCSFVNVLESRRTHSP